MAKIFPHLPEPRSIYIVVSYVDIRLNMYKYTMLRIIMQQISHTKISYDFTVIFSLLINYPTNEFSFDFAIKFLKNLKKSYILYCVVPHMISTPAIIYIYISLCPSM